MMPLFTAPGDPNGVMRDRIIRSIIARSSGWPDPYGGAFAASGAPSYSQLDIVDPSDPASYDSTLGDIVSGFPSPTVHNPNNVIDPTDMMSNMQNVPAEINDQGLNVSTNSPQNEALNDSVQAALDVAIAANITSPEANNYGDPGFGLGTSFGTGKGFGTAQDANDAVAAALSDAIAASPGPADTGATGFGTGTGFSSADAANSAVAGALADAGDAAGVAGLGGGFSGDSSSGGGAGGGGGK
jgi:hypothetical protein